MERVLMRIAVASEGLEVAPRFRQCASYMCYRVDRGIIVECQNLPNPGLAAPKLVALLVEMGVDTLIVCGCDTNICVLHTLAGAFYRGYRTVVAADACGTFLVGTQEAGLDYFVRCFDSRVVDTQHVLGYLRG